MKTHTKIDFSILEKAFQSAPLFGEDSTVGEYSKNKKDPKFESHITIYLEAVSKHQLYEKVFILHKEFKNVTYLSRSLN